MRQPKIIRKPNAAELINRSTKIKVDISPQEHMSDYHIKDDSKKLKKFVKNIKKLMRSSYEYRQFNKFLKEHSGMGLCGNHPNITWEDGFSIEIHHYPLTAEDIVYTVIYKRIEMNECLKMTSILDELIMLHYIGLIGLYPYCTTCHQHDSSVENDDFIALDALYGSPEKFFELYGTFMTEDLQSKLKTYFKADEAYQIIDNNIDEKVVKNWIYIEDDGVEYISMSKIANLVEDIYNRYK